MEPLTELDAVLLRRMAEILDTLAQMRRHAFPIPEWAELPILFDHIEYNRKDGRFEFSLGLPPDWATSDMAADYRAAFMAASSIPGVGVVRVETKPGFAPCLRFDVEETVLRTAELEVWVGTHVPELRRFLRER